MPALPTLFPTADEAVGSWTDESGGTTNLFSFVDENTAGDGDNIRSALNAADGIAFFMTDVPSDFERMSDLSVVIRHARGGVEGGDNGGGSDTFTLRVRIVSADGFILAGGTSSTSLTVETGTVGYLAKTETIPFTYLLNTVGGMGTKARWNGASIVINVDFTQQGGADGDRIWIDFIRFTGNYVSQSGGAAPPALYTTNYNSGPCKRSADDHLYAVFTNTGNTAADQIRIMKSEDDGENWSNVFEVDPPNGTVNIVPSAVEVLQDGDLLHIFWVPNSTTGRLVYVQFDMSDDTVGTPHEIDDDYQQSNVSAGIRSTGELVVAYRALSTEINVYRGSGTSWTLHSDISAPAGLSNPTSPAVVIDASDNAHIFFHGATTQVGVYHRVLRADNTLSTYESITTSGTSLQERGLATLFDNRLFVMQREADQDVTIWEGNVAEDATWTQTVLGAGNDTGTSGSYMGLVQDADQLVACWIRDSDQDMRYRQRTGQNAWSTEASGADTTFGEGTTRNFRGFNRGGDFIVGAFHAGGAFNNSPIYHEFVIAPAGLALLKIQDEDSEVGETNLHFGGGLKLHNEAAEVSESVIYILEASGAEDYTGWGIPI